MVVALTGVPQISLAFSPGNQSRLMNHQPQKRTQEARKSKLPAATGKKNRSTRRRRRHAAVTEAGSRCAAYHAAAAGSSYHQLAAAETATATELHACFGAITPQRHELSIQGGKRDCFLNAATSSSSSRLLGRSACRRGPGWLFGAGRQYHPVPVSFSLEMGGVSQLDSNFPICKLCSAYHPHKGRDGSPLS